MDTLKKKYGFWTAVAMVVGIVIGSGVFFKAPDVLERSGGNLLLSLLAWIVGAFAMIFGALVFAEVANRIEKVNGIVDYTEEAYGKLAGYMMGWFKGLLYYFPLTAVLGWVSSMYTVLLIYGNTRSADEIVNSIEHWLIAVVYITVAFIINFIGPKLAGFIQVSTTVIKLIPLVLIAIVGTFYGLINGVVVENFVEAGKSFSNSIGSFTTAVVATAFAYEGWIVATTINDEIIDSKKNLPKALALGTIIVFIVYVIYFIGIASILPTSTIIAEGHGAVSIAANILFGKFGGTILTIFVIISCLGTLNGLAIASIRTPYSLAVRGQGPFPKFLSKVNKRTNMPLGSVMYGLVFALTFLLVWCGSFEGWWNGKFIDISELPIVLIYFAYMFIYIWVMVTFKNLGFVKRFIFPTFALIGSFIIVYGGLSKESAVIDVTISVVGMLIGIFFYRKNNVEEI
ncbi:amino acid permease [Mycoplasmatota bacterium]|nr:amino acid permease [Mycoplasmatota bacterium]